ncbi:NAD-dependent epimerase/dehydratase family protein [Alkalihalobacillus sp. MEB130]|uniref:NAD-dependent epimerase/dehydratase family protein n=1 Tax=Alkalihalobacillus sp. MEB130 TaxID=2976704 RepID=UPI0028DF54F2|nr:NAD-dependent epimerase/dehydratase family protein [Alkalihalobacillus sp. MEB130]MDT8860606.1 NAD-dependent epimerase/dehydratase family protein [Alkalihalobacillus sp. MEB130]
MNILVTGAAGFIGSHLCERLLEDSKNHVFGIDSYIGPTPQKIKKGNVTSLLNHPRFTFYEEDLASIKWEFRLQNIDYVFHLAGMPGVRSSWGTDFREYVKNNIEVTQNMLEASKHVPIKKFIYASTSSVYGEKSGKVSEDAILEPMSPYGITKLTGEYLCHVYRESFGVPTVILRYFTVYGPRQRSDMAFHRFIKSVIEDKPVTIYGDGTQTRDFTFVRDCARATASVMHAERVIGETINIGGKERASVNEVISQIERLLNKKANIHYAKAAIGEPKHTWADISKAESLLAYKPQYELQAGLKEEIEYIKNIYKM